MAASQSSKNLYAVLGLTSTATKDEIRERYRTLALERHPDKNGGTAESTAAFQELNDAYETLIDPQRRQRYDEIQSGFQRQGSTWTHHAAGSYSNTARSENDETGGNTEDEEVKELLVMELSAALARQVAEDTRLEARIKFLEAEIERLRQPDDSKTPYQRAVEIRAAEVEIACLNSKRLTIENTIEAMEEVIMTHIMELHRMRQRNQARSAQERAEEQLRRGQERRAEEARARQAEEARRRANAASCRHKAEWHRVQGQHQCTECGAVQKRFAFKCLGCKKVACMECRRVLTGEGTGKSR
ncbi:hypothetical protein PRZ48_013246 [Zasmidium cellare]|uniref:J domain-containing protein n=1 Tax=Zasmidium cellare TaxID=395010 RepID=A0ABR0E3H7_ZASCE|nr:hypothetical protein PRZ48_013246 [Zasmidium cellare]